MSRLSRMISSASGTNICTPLYVYRYQDLDRIYRLDGRSVYWNFRSPPQCAYVPRFFVDPTLTRIAWS